MDEKKPSKLKTLGEARGLSFEREKEICKLIGEIFKELKESDGFDPSKAMAKIENDGLEEKELRFALWVGGFYSALIDTPRIILVRQIQTQKEDGGMYV